MGRFQIGSDVFIFDRSQVADAADNGPEGEHHKIGHAPQLVVSHPQAQSNHPRGQPGTRIQRGRWQTNGAIKTTLTNWLAVTLFLRGVHPDRIRKYYDSVLVA